MKLTVHDARTLAERVMTALGHDSESAALIADHLIDCELRGISYMSYSDLSQKPEVIGLVADAVRQVNRTLPQGLKLRRFVSLHKEFDPDDGEITRTRKLRRNVVEERYAPIIDAIYGGAKAVAMRAQIVYETGATGVTERLLAIEEI